MSGQCAQTLKDALLLVLKTFLLSRMIVMEFRHERRAYELKMVCSSDSPCQVHCSWRTPHPNQILHKKGSNHKQNLDDSIFSHLILLLLPM